MRLRHIEIFQAVYQTGSVSEAAKLLNISQPAVSSILQHAESQLGFPLFHRIRGRLVVSPEGEALIKEAQKVSEKVDSIRRLAFSLRRQPDLNLRIGATPSLAVLLFPKVIKEWSVIYPHSKCELTSSNTSELVKQLMAKEIDLALTLCKSDHPGLSIRELVLSELTAVASETCWPSVSAVIPLQAEELIGQPIIGLLDSDPLSQLTDEFCRRGGLEPDIRIRVQTYALSLAMATSGAGIAFIDPFTACLAHGVQKRRLSPPVEVGLYALSRKNDAHSFLLDQLVERFSEIAGDLLKAE